MQVEGVVGGEGEGCYCGLSGGGWRWCVGSGGWEGVVVKGDLAGGDGGVGTVRHTGRG